MSDIPQGLVSFDVRVTDDAFEDPLGIAQSWEEKHGKPKADAIAEGEDAT